MRVKVFNVLRCSALTGLVFLSVGCGDFIRQDRSPVTLVIDKLEAASGTGGTSATYGGTLQSDVVTSVDGTPTLYSDSGKVTMRSFMKDVGTRPTDVNSVTISRYRVTFRRADGRNTPGVDVPFPFDSAVTFTLAADASVEYSFELVRHVAKMEAPLSGLAYNDVIISTVADVTFFGRDQAGNEIVTSGSIGVQFGNFADPD